MEFLIPELWKKKHLIQRGGYERYLNNWLVIFWVNPWIPFRKSIMICSGFFRNISWLDSGINALCHLFIQALHIRPSVSLLGIWLRMFCLKMLKYACTPWRMTILLGCSDHEAYLTLQNKRQVTLAQCCISCRMEANALRRRKPPQSIESENRAPIVGKVHVQFLRWVIVRHEREDRGHDEAWWLRLQICCADEDVHAG